MHVFTTPMDEEEVGRAQLLPFGHDRRVDAKQPSGGLGQARGCSRAPWKVGDESNQRTFLNIVRNPAGGWRGRRAGSIL